MSDIHHVHVARAMTITTGLIGGDDPARIGDRSASTQINT